MPQKPKEQFLKRQWRAIKESRWLLLMFLPVFIYFCVFKYGAMTWLIIAFKKFSAIKGIWGSKWVGTKYFEKFLFDDYFWKLVRNTVVLNLELLVFSFPIAIILALMINECNAVKFKKTVQTVSYLPYFVSTVAICGLIKNFLSSDGIITIFLRHLGVTSSLLMDAKAFRPIYIISEIWKTAGWVSPSASRRS